jgi:hypothetical protein
MWPSAACHARAYSLPELFTVTNEADMWKGSLTALARGVAFATIAVTSASAQGTDPALEARAIVLMAP